MIATGGDSFVELLFLKSDAPSDRNEEKPCSRPDSGHTALC